MTLSDIIWLTCDSLWHQVWHLATGSQKLGGKLIQYQYLGTKGDTVLEVLCLKTHKHNPLRNSIGMYVIWECISTSGVLICALPSILRTFCNPQWLFPLFLRITNEEQLGQTFYASTITFVYHNVWFLWIPDYNYMQFWQCFGDDCPS